jgi:hypothetical protein
LTKTGFLLVADSFVVPGSDVGLISWWTTFLQLPPAGAPRMKYPAVIKTGAVMNGIDGGFPDVDSKNPFFVRIGLRCRFLFVPPGTLLEIAARNRDIVGSTKTIRTRQPQRGCNP